MKGLNQRSLTGELVKVPAHQAHNPIETIADLDQKAAAWRRVRVLYDGVKDYSFEEDYHRAPLKAFRNFSFDELCKLWYSRKFTMERSVSDFFETNAQYEVVRKIESSMWRWSVRKGTWNEVVDAYDGIRRFVFTQDPHFEIRLDYTTYWNLYGHAKYSCLFLDGVFAFLLYYRHTHVMTVGFSVLSDRRILIQQVQSPQQSGNRFLYKLPQNRMEFVIERFAANFPQYRLFIIDGAALVEKTLADYRESLARITKRNDPDDEELPVFEKRIEHLEADKPRLAAFYRNVGKYTLGESREFKGLLHNLVV